MEKLTKLVTWGACFAAILFSQAIQAGASEIRGGRGGSPFTMACEQGEKIGGFQIRMGKVLDGLGIACIPTRASLNGNPIIDGFTGNQGGNDYRYNVGRSRFVKSISFTACKYKGRTLVRSLRVTYFVPGNGANARGSSRVYGTHCGSSHGAVITHTAPFGQHIYGITGKSGSAVDSLGVVFRPLPVIGRQQRIPLAGLIQAVNRSVFNESRFVFDNLGSYGKNGGFLENASLIDVAGYVDTFSIPAYSHRRNKGLYRVEYYLNDLRSNEMFLSRGDQHPSHLKLTVNMETRGREIKGFCRKKVGKKYYLCANNGDVLPDAELESPRVIMQLVPEVFNGRCGNNNVNSIALTVTASDFYGRLKFAGDWNRVPDIIEKRFKRGIEDRHLNKLLQDMAIKAEKAANQALNSNQVQCALAAPIRDFIDQTLGGVRINAVGIQGNQLVIGF